MPAVNVLKAGIDDELYKPDKYYKSEINNGFHWNQNTGVQYLFGTIWFGPVRSKKIRLNEL